MATSTSGPPDLPKPPPLSRAGIGTGHHAPKWSKEKIIEHFQGREKKYGELAARVVGSPLNFDYPYDGTANIVLAWFWLIDFMPRPVRVLDLGCGAGTFRKLWEHGFGLAYVGVDSSPPALAAARKLWPPDAQERFHHGDITEPQFAAHGLDLVFAHGALMHLGPDDVARVAAWTRPAARAVMICEKVRWAENEEPAPHVWIHDYDAIFGQPSYRAVMNSTKDVFIWTGRG